MQVLSLSEFPFSEPGSQFNVEGWVKERDSLLASVESLKGLITQMQTHSTAQVLEASTHSITTELVKNLRLRLQKDLTLRLEVPINFLFASKNLTCDFFKWS